MKSFSRLFLLAASAFALACGGRPDPVRATLDRLVELAEERDAEGFRDSLSSDFQAGDGSDRAAAQATLRRYFAAYENLGVRISELSIERAPEAARAAFRADLSGRPRRIGGIEGWLPRSSSYRFELRLVPEGNRWKVAWASWEEAGPNR